MAKRLPKRAQKLFLAILDMVQSGKAENGAVLSVGGGIDKPLSSRDCFRQVTEDARKPVRDWDAFEWPRSNDVY